MQLMAAHLRGDVVCIARVDACTGEDFDSPGSQFHQLPQPPNSSLSGLGPTRSQHALHAAFHELLERSELISHLIEGTMENHLAASTHGQHFTKMGSAIF